MSQRKSTESKSKLNHTSARHWISTNPFAVLKSLSKSPSAAETQQAYLFWVNRETRRRLLLASFILDTQHAALFGQQSVLFPKRPSGIFSTSPSTLPCPCDNELWECRSVKRWAELASSSNQQNSLSDAADPAIYDSLDAADLFRSRSILGYIATYPSHGERDTDNEMAAFCESLAKHSPSGHYIQTKFDFHAHNAAQHTPVRSLLIVSGESWLFGKKLEKEVDFHAAKSNLREWVGSSEAQSALRHATALLRMVFNVEPGTVANLAEVVGAQDRNMGMLHEQWCSYIAALICWACTFDATISTEFPAVSSTASTSLLSSMLSGITSPEIPPSITTSYPPLVDAITADAQMRSFLQTIEVDELGGLPASANVEGQIKGLLEVVRTRKINGSHGGLLNEASGVLYRLVEGRSRLSHF